MAAQGGVSELVNAFWRVKWWKYRYVLLAALLVNAFLINQFFFNSPPISIPFSTTPAAKDNTQEQERPIPPPQPPVNPTPAVHVPPVPSAKNPGAQSSSKLLEALPISSSVVQVIPAIPTSSSPNLFSLHDYSFDGEYIGWPLQRVCNETQWQPGLTFICDNNSGGIGNIRNFILTCIRYGIDAGASELIMPQIQQRSEEDLANIFTSTFHPFDYFFDKEHFLKAMAQNCPQMVVRQSVSQLPNAKKLLNRTEFYPKDLNVDFDGCDERGVNRHLDMFRPKFNKWLEGGEHPPTVAEPVSVRFKWATFFEWPVYRDGPEFVNTFGDLLRFRKDIRELAEVTLQEMEKFVGATPEPPKLSAPFLGMHLRTEADSLAFWPSFDEQSNGFLEQAKNRGFTHAFLASGDAKEGDKLKAKAVENHNLKVATKLDLLKGDALKRLTDMSWDQQALVDFLVLTKSAHFTGCSFSSFTMNIAFKRHVMTRGINTLQWRSPGDVYSTLIGRFESWYGDWMFMYECMWP